jgi:hypothetical protein
MGDEDVGWTGNGRRTSRPRRRIKALKPAFFLRRARAPRGARAPEEPPRCASTAAARTTVPIASKPERRPHLGGGGSDGDEPNEPGSASSRRVGRRRVASRAARTFDRRGRERPVRCDGDVRRSAGSSRARAAGTPRETDATEGKGRRAAAAVTRNGHRRGGFFEGCGVAGSSGATGVIRSDSSKTQRTSGPAAGCNRPAATRGEEAVKVARNGGGGTGARRVAPSRPSGRARARLGSGPLGSRTVGTQSGPSSGEEGSRAPPGTRALKGRRSGGGSARQPGDGLRERVLREDLEGASGNG